MWHDGPGTPDSDYPLGWESLSGVASHMATRFARVGPAQQPGHRGDDRQPRPLQSPFVIIPHLWWATSTGVSVSAENGGTCVLEWLRGPVESLDSARLDGAGVRGSEPVGVWESSQPILQHGWRQSPQEDRDEKA